MHDVLHFEQKAVENFFKTYNDSILYRGLRLGQAFYQRFKLEKLSDQTQAQKLYQLDGEEAKAFIRQNFSIV